MTITFEQLPVVFQGGARDSADWCRRHAGARYGYQKLEDSWKQEALKIWNGESYDINNILENVNNTGRRVNIEGLLNRLVRFKSTRRFGEGADKAYGGERNPPLHDVSIIQFEAWEEKTQQLQTQLTQAQQQVNQQQQTITNLNNQVTNLNNTNNSQLQSQLTAAQLQNAQLQKEKEALQKKVNELNEVITGVPQPQVDTEARVQQTSLLPK